MLVKEWAEGMGGRCDFFLVLGEIETFEEIRWFGAG